MKLACVGDPLVDQDQAGAVFDEQLAQHVAGTGRLFIVGFDARESFLSAELPRQLAPKRTHDGAVGLGARVAWGDLVAYQNDTFDGRQRLGFAFQHHRVDAHQLLGRDAREQVIQRQHRVRLAAAEIGL